MSYTFSTTGETRASLLQRVVFQSFSETRYTEFTKRALNDAVTAICRKLGVFEAYEVQAYDSSGIVTVVSARPWFRIDEVWTTNATQASQGEAAFMAAASVPLQRLAHHEVGAVGAGSGPVGYIVRRAQSPSGLAPVADLRVLPPAAAGGFVAIRGLQRPPVMDSDDDPTGLGAELDGAVVAFAKAACFDNEDDADMATYWRNRYDAELRQATEGGDDNDGPDTVDGMWDC